MRWKTLIFSFVSERAALDFERFMADEYEIEVEIGSYLHIEVPSEEFEDEGALIKLHGEVERFGGSVHM